MIVLDTNVVSELMRAVPAREVVAWVQVQPPADLWTTAVTLAEVRYGIARLPEGRRKLLLGAAADDVFTQFADQVLPFDAAAAGDDADIVVEREHLGEPISGSDAQIAAVCRSHRVSLATRSTDDFHHLGLRLIDPWSHAGA